MHVSDEDICLRLHSNERSYLLLSYLTSSSIYIDNKIRPKSLPCERSQGKSLEKCSIIYSDYQKVLLER